MKDLSRASVPFTFDDLAREGSKRPESVFVSLFRSEPATAEEESVEEAQAPISDEDLARRAFDDAYAEGEKAGYEMGMRRADLLAKRLEGQIEEVTLFKKTLAERLEGLAVHLAVTFAEALILRECAESRDILAGMIRKAPEIYEERGEIVIRVRSEDLSQVKAMASENVRVIADDTLREPGFLIETSVGDIDGRISSQIEELKNVLIGCGDA